MAQEIISLAEAKGLHLATAESITAGLICSALVETAGASKVVLGGINCYQDAIKQQLLGVPSSLLQQQSAVDPEVAAHLASQVRAKFASAMQLLEDSVMGISSTGIAGPDTLWGKAVGEVYLGVSSSLGTKVFAEQFQGSRAEIRLAARDRALQIIREELASFLVYHPENI
jgi:PncC family amidohydrolase